MGLPSGRHQTLRGGGGEWGSTRGSRLSPQPRRSAKKREDASQIDLFIQLNPGQLLENPRTGQGSCSADVRPSVVHNQSISARQVTGDRRHEP